MQSVVVYQYCILRYCILYTVYTVVVFFLFSFKHTIGTLQKQKILGCVYRLPRIDYNGTYCRALSCVLQGIERKMSYGALITYWYHLPYHLDGFQGFSPHILGTRHTEDF